MSKEHRIELTDSEVLIPGLKLFGYNIFNDAQPPMGMHMHENCVEIVVVSKGREYYSVESETFCVSRGQAFISFANELHKSGMGLQNICEFYWFILDISSPLAFLGFSEDYANKIIEHISSLKNHIIPISESCIENLKECFELFKNKADICYRASMFQFVLSKILFESAKEKSSDNIIDTVSKYIDENIFENIDLNDIAAYTGISLPALHRKFQRESGYTLRNYINLQKTERAKLLLKSSKSVTETAMALGFNTSDYFSTVFKKFTSMTPTQYIKKKDI